MTGFKTRKKDKRVFPVSSGKEYRKKDDYKEQYSDKDREEIDDMCYDIHDKSFEELTPLQQQNALKTFNKAKKSDSQLKNALVSLPKRGAIEEYSWEDEGDEPYSHKGYSVSVGDEGEILVAHHKTKTKNIRIDYDLEITGEEEASRLIENLKQKGYSVKKEVFYRGAPYNR